MVFIEIEPPRPGELSFKAKGGLMTLVGALIVGLSIYEERVNATSWEWGSIPVGALGWIFVALGVLAVILGVVKKA